MTSYQLECCKVSHCSCVGGDAGVNKSTVLPVVRESSTYTYVEYIVLGHDNKQLCYLVYAFAILCLYYNLIF